MGNLNELHVPPNADEAADFAARREFGLRYDSYREGLVRDAGLREIVIDVPGFMLYADGVLVVTEKFACHNPEQAWIDMLSDSGHSVKV